MCVCEREREREGERERERARARARAWVKAWTSACRVINHLIAMHGLRLAAALIASGHRGTMARQRRQRGHGGSRAENLTRLMTARRERTNAHHAGRC